MRHLLLLALGLPLVMALPASAQEFSVYTKVFNLAGPKPKKAPEVIVRSLTLFHAGKAYDKIHSAGEITIFEPARRRFIVLNGPRRLVTEVRFDQINASLRQAEQAIREYVDSLKLKGAPTSTAAATALAAQLDPRFSERFDRARSTLTLTGQAFRYRVRYSGTPDPRGSGIDRTAFEAAVKRYLDYADWTARLNFLLHPQALYPTPRVELNTALKTRKLLPVAVELQANTAGEFHLRAEHQFRWKLTGKDRDDIRYWNSLVTSRTLRQVKFAEYRRRLVSSK